MKRNKFRIYNNKQRKFEYFELWNITVSDLKLAYEPIHQFIGIFDKNVKEVYEKDVVSVDSKLGVIEYNNHYCAYVIDTDNEQGNPTFIPLSNLSLDTLEVVGNMVEDYMYNEKGKLVKYEKN